MFKFLFNSTIIYLVMAFLYGCNDASLLGSDFFGEDDFEASVIDTLSVRLSTVKYDSLITSSSDNALVGSHEDELIGSIAASYYFLFSPSSSDLALGLDVDVNPLDSVTIRFKCNGYGTVSKVEGFFQLKVSQLQTELEVRDDGNLYNTSSFDSPEPVVLGTKTIRNYVEDGEVIEITLDADFANEIYTQMAEENETMTSDIEFLQHFHGFCLSSGTEAPFGGFYADSTVLRVYYTDKNATPVAQEYSEMVISSDQPTFSRIYSENLNDSLQTLETYEDLLLSNNLNHRAVVRSGLGFSTRLEIPGARSLLLDGMNYLISYSELRLSVLDYEPHDENVFFPENLIGYIVDHDNEIISDAEFEFYFHPDNDLFINHYYSLDVSALMEYLLQEYENTSDVALLITTPDDEMKSTVSGITFGDTAFDTKLILYTITSR